MGTYSVEDIENQAHGDAKLLKVEIAIVVDVGEIPDPLELVVAEAAVLEDGRGLLSGEVLAAARAIAKDVPVGLNLLGFNFGRHRGKGRTGGLAARGEVSRGATELR